jgi:hypothetical protein
VAPPRHSRRRPSRHVRALPGCLDEVEGRSHVSLDVPLVRSVPVKCLTSLKFHQQDRGVSEPAGRVQVITVNGPTPAIWRRPP